MTVIILAAGTGIRFDIGSKKNHYPKCLIKLIDSKTLLELNINKLLSLSEIKHIYIVTGYKYKLINKLLYLAYPNVPIIKTVYNPEFKKSIIHSVRKGFNNIINQQTVLLLNGDTYFDMDVFSQAYEISKKSNDTITVFGHFTNKIYDDDILLNINKGKIHNVGKRIKKANGVSSGAILMCNHGLREYLDAINFLSIDKFQTHHEVLKFISDSGFDIDFVNLGSRKWLEVDRQSDLDRALKYYPNLNY